MKTQQRANGKHVDKRDLIIRKAITLFAEHGYENVRVSDITEGIDIGKGTLYLYFKNKKDLLIECFRELNRLLIPLEMRNEIRDEKDIFVKGRYRWIGFAEQYSTFGGILNILRTACSSHDEEIRKRAKETFDIIIAPLRRDIKKAIADGIIWDVDPELASYFLLGAAENLAFRLSLDSHYTIEEVSEAIYWLHQNALAAEKTKSKSVASTDGFIGMITDVNGVSTEIRQIKFGSKPFLSGRIGGGEIKIDPEKICSIEIKEIDTHCYARVRASNGQDMNIEIDCENVIYAESFFGTLQIPINKVSSITFMGMDR